LKVNPSGETKRINGTAPTVHIREGVGAKREKNDAGKTEKRLSPSKTEKKKAIKAKGPKKWRNFTRTKQAGGRLTT